MKMSNNKPPCKGKTYMKTAARKVKRNEELFKAKESGMTFKAVGAKFHITNTRAKQVYYRELELRDMKPIRYREWEAKRAERKAKIAKESTTLDKA